MRNAMEPIVSRARGRGCSSVASRVDLAAQALGKFRQGAQDNLERRQRAIKELDPHDAARPYAVVYRRWILS